MITDQTHRRFQIRKIIAVAALCLFVLRGLSFLGVSAALAASPDATGPGLSASLLEEQCERRDKSGDRSTHEECSDCCVLCMSAARTAALLSVSSLTGVLSLSERESMAPRIRLFDLDAQKPPGLIANWSATSPPRRS